MGKDNLVSCKTEEVMYDYQPTESDYEDMHDYFVQMQYETRKWDVRCAICGDAERDTQQNLEAKGWQLGKSETCFRCTDDQEYRRA